MTQQQRKTDPWLHSPESNRTRGASLIEVLIAILLFSLGTLTALTTTLTSFQANNQARAIDGGANLARTYLDQLVALDYNDPKLNDNKADGPAGLLAETPGTADSSETVGRFLVCWNVAENLPVNNVKTISVIVSWQMGADVRRVVFQTLKAG